MTPATDDHLRFDQHTSNLCSEATMQLNLWVDTKNMWENLRKGQYLDYLESAYAAM